MVDNLAKLNNIKSNLFKQNLAELNVFEGNYLKNILIELYLLLKDSFFEYEFWIYSKQTHEPNNYLIPKSSKKQIIFMIADEKGIVPQQLLSQATAVFKNYINPNHPFPNLFYFPLGYNQNTPEQTILPINERKYNVFFSGNLHTGRANLYRSLTHTSFIPFSVVHRLQSILGLNFDNRFPESYIRFTKGFASGLSSSDYSRYLYNSKIILCPPGYINAETFRHYEALRAGCIVISEEIPIINLYPESPIIWVKNWKESFAIIEKLLQNPTLMNQLQQKTIKWYSTYLAEKQIAGQIAAKLNDL